MAYFNVVISTFRALYCSCSDWMGDKTALFWRLYARDSVFSGVSVSENNVKIKHKNNKWENIVTIHVMNIYVMHVASNHLACALQHSPMQRPMYQQDPCMKVTWVLKPKGWISCGSSGSETGYYWAPTLTTLSLFLALALITAKWNIRGASCSLRENCSDPNSRGTDR